MVYFVLQPIITWINEYIFQLKHMEAILPNNTRKLLWSEISKMLIAVFKNKFIVLFIRVKVRLSHTFVQYC